MTDPRWRDWLDRPAAVRATLVVAIVLAVLLLVQAAVTAAVTDGTQPIQRVERIPESPAASTWDDAPARTVTLSRQEMAVPYGGGSVDELRVQSAINDSHVAVRLDWRDPTNDTSLAEPRAFSDAAAIMFYNGELPPITMGEVGTPVNVWYWRAAWQYDDRPRGEWTGDMYTYPHPDAETRPGLAANNPLSNVTRNRLAHNYYAEGFGSLSHASAQPVDASAVRDGDRWAVTFVRERQTDGPHDATFGPDDDLYLAFGVWNGSASEVNGEKSITLQFTTLDVASGELQPASPDDGAGDGSGGDSPSGPGGGGGLLVNYVGALLAVAFITWTFAYWRAVQ